MRALGVWLAVLSLTALSCSTPIAAQPATPAAAATPKLFAVEITTGPGWDTAKPPPQQAFFREHSAHLKKLRDEGRIRMGARYADKGLIVIEAADEAEARALIEADPSMKAGTFKFTLAEMRVFYPGQVGSERKPSP
ncbi:MAG: YciI family protein [Burkholderiales bacterium]|nr:YciI family protein [Burkholderiales bacterium]